MSLLTLCLALSVLAGAVCAAPGELSARADETLSAESVVDARRTTRTTRATSADAWLSLISEYVKEGGVGSGDADWFPRPVPIMLPFGRGADQQLKSLPILVVPVPVPTRSRSDAECTAKTSPSPSDPSRPADVVQPINRPRPPPHQGRHPLNPVVAPVILNSVPDPALVPDPDELVTDDPILAPAGSAQRLVELFRAEQPTAPHLPPMLIALDNDDDEVDIRQPVSQPDPPPAPQRQPQPPARAQRGKPQRRDGGQEVRTEPPTPSPSAEPPRPRFDKSLMLRGELTVPRADYTETYVAWWDSSSGAARVDYFSGGTSTYRMIDADGTVRRAEVRVDRTGERYVLRCAVTTPQHASLSDRAPPALPDISLFTFAGYAERESGRVERWRHTASGRGGELGAVASEQLTFRHELELHRAADNYTAVPIKYTVSVDSSILGPDCEGYEHRYMLVRLGDHDPAVLQIDLAEVCEVTDQTDDMERVEPLREFTMLHRDPKYDSKFERFQRQFRRAYENDVERAVRKTILIKQLRFQNAGNRMGSTAVLENNFLGDRLEVELQRLLGVDTRDVLDTLVGGEDDGARTRREARREMGRLPRAFDWRERGAVTDVRFQGSCSSCWAFAVTGAVEGALFLRTGRLTPLSEQQLVDCAQPFGGHGCGGTWPRAAYDYVQNRGMKARDHYLPYQARETKPCLDKNFPTATYISGHVNVTQHSVRALKAAVRRHAPTVVIVDAKAKSFIFYKGGVLNDNRCGRRLKKLNHAVLAVGWGEKRGMPYFILKNSWSDRWGENGYIKLGAATNTCGVLTAPSYPILELEDVQRPGDKLQRTNTVASRVH